MTMEDFVGRVAGENGKPIPMSRLLKELRRFPTPPPCEVLEVRNAKIHKRRSLKKVGVYTWDTLRLKF